MSGSYRARPKTGTHYLVDRRGRTRPASAFALHPGKFKLGAAVLAFAIAAPASTLHSGVRTAGAAVWADASALIQGRSPGLRRVAEYIKGQRVTPAARARPRAKPRRAIASTRPPFVPSVPPPAILPIALSDAPLAPGPVDIAFAAPPAVDFVDFSPVIVPGLGIKEFVFVGGGGGPAGTTPPPTGGPPIGPPPPAPGVPEPSSWTTMIAGFAILGWMWRRRRVFLRLLTYVPLPRLAYLPIRR